MEHRDERPDDDLLSRALSEQLAEQRSLNRLIGTVERSLAEVAQRLDAVEHRLADQEEAVRDVGRLADSAGEVLAQQLEELPRLRAVLSDDVEALTERVEALIGAAADAAARLAAVDDVVEAVGGHSGELLDAARVLYGAEAEIRDALDALGERLEKALTKAARAARKTADRGLTCGVCGFTAKTAAGLSAHQRSHR